MTLGTIYISDLDVNGKVRIIDCKVCGDSFRDGDWYIRHLSTCGVKFEPRETYDEMVGN